MLRDVTGHLVNRIENIFVQMSDATRKLNDFVLSIKQWQHLIPRDWVDVIKRKQGDHAGDESKTQRKLSSMLENIRSGKAEESEMENLLDKFEANDPCSIRSIEQFLRENNRIESKIEMLTKFNKYLPIKIESIADFILEFQDKDLYLLHICEQWQTKDKRNWLKQSRYFSTLITTEIDAKFYLIDHDFYPDLDEKPDKCVIYWAKHGAIESKDYYDYSLSEFISNTTYWRHSICEW